MWQIDRRNIVSVWADASFSLFFSYLFLFAGYLGLVGFDEDGKGGLRRSDSEMRWLG